MTRRWTRRSAVGCIVVLATVALVTAASAGAQRSAKPSAAARVDQLLAGYPRSQTLITSGTQWGNIAGTNPYVGNYAAGMVGLVNETLQRFDPVKGTYIDWLAQSAKWTGPKQFTVVVRSGVKWADGKAFTGSDVAYNLNLLRFNTSPWNNLYLNVKKPVKAKGNTVVVNFKSTPNYVQWQNAMWNIPMISPSQSKTLITTAQSLTTYSPGNPIGTGPYQLDAKGYDPTTRVVWVRKAHWWAADQGVSPAPKPKYIIDLVNTSNTNALSGVLSGLEDLNNNYLPGVETLVGKGTVSTYFPGAPYMLSANTAWLEPNTTHKPLNDPVFRKALAESININQIVTQDYHNLVLPASPSGLLPTWSKYIDKSSVAANGFKYNPTDAQSILTAAGYKKDSSGMFMNKDGSAINLDISVPQGWSDWEAARDMIVASAKAAGIRITAKVKDFNTWQSDRNTGNFDLVVDNNYQISDNPYTYWKGIFNLPIITTGTGQTNFNFERYSNPAAWALVQKLDKTPPTNTEAVKSINSQLQTTLMKDLPMIPLWYNGVWAQFTSKYWTNWPSATTSRKYFPAMWRGYLQMTGIDMITHLKSK
jgi:peptide/nickel transport system substrate-binding protein